MKRTFESMGAPTTAGQISTFQTTTKENVFLNTNMVCIQAEDHTSSHGIKSSFSQTRVLPIVGKTARAEIGVRSIDIQTKILPVFQPQVCLNSTDPDNLVYEVGISTTYRQSLINADPNGTILPTYDLIEDNFSMNSSIGGVVPLSTQWKIHEQTTSQAYPTVSSPLTGVVSLVDSYDQRYTLTSYNVDQDVDLRAVMDKWNGFYSPSNPSQIFELNKTCLSALVIPSVKQKLTSFGPFQSSVEYPGKYFCPVESTSGFSIGDPVKFFGISDIDNLNVVPKLQFGKIVDVIQYNLLQSPSDRKTPTLVVDVTQSLGASGSRPANSTAYTFTLNATTNFSIFQDAIDEYGFYIGQRITCYDTTSALSGTYYISALVNVSGRLQVQVVGPSNPTAVTNASVNIQISSIFQGGYIINLSSVDGGHIEFLTNENSFQPFQATCYDNTIINEPNNQQLLRIKPAFFNWESSLLPNATKPYCDWPNMGWLRGNMAPVVGQAARNKTIVNIEVVATPNTSYANMVRYRDAFNGTYRMVLVIQNGAKTEFALERIDRSTPDGTYNFVTDGITLKVSLAPNAYTLITDVTTVNPTESIPNLQWMQAFGFKPTESLTLSKASTPPYGPIAQGTWARAFNVVWNMSAYRNLTWKTQDLLAAQPRPPVETQDFTGTYYNVYEMNKFIMDCVNPAIESCIESPPVRFDFNAMCLNDQLRLIKAAYCMAQITPAVVVWNSTTQWEAFITLCPSNTPGARLFMTKRELPPNTALPAADITDENYYYLGRLAVYPSNAPPSNPYQVYFILGDTSISSSIGGTINNGLSASIMVKPPPVNAYAPWTINRTNAMSFAMFAPSMSNLDASQDVYSTTQKVFGTPYLNYPAIAQFQYNAADKYRVCFRTDKLITKAPVFDYDELRLLFTMTYDGTGYGTKQVDMDLPQETQALLQYKRLSWGNNNGNDEWLSFESNSAFKYLFDNFSAYCIPYSDTLPYLRSQNAPVYPFVAYWIYDQNDDNIAPTATNKFYTVFQSCESLSCCITPVQSIVVVSDNIPVVEQLTSPVQYLLDSDSQYYYKNDTVSTTSKIIGEVYLPNVAPHSVRSVVKFEDQDVQYHQLLDTKLFKQLEYSLYYRHRITQQLIPLILTNYGSVNIKFIFRPLEHLKG